MESLDINTVLGIALGYLVALALRMFSRTRFWSRVRARAQSVLDDPTIPVDDPRVAAERALVDAQRSRVDSVAKAITPPAGDNSDHKTDSA